MEKFNIGEPWKTDTDGNQRAITNGRGYDVCYLNFYLAKERQVAYAHRIIACVNGCTGIENPGVVGEVVEALKDAEKALERLCAFQTPSLYQWLEKKIDDALTHIEGVET